MNKRYNYKSKNNCIYLIDNKTENCTRLTNFTASITKEIVSETNDGNNECDIQLEGVMESGEVLKAITINATDLENNKWFRKNWGIQLNLNDLEIKDAHKHLSEAIRKLSRNKFPREYRHFRIGLAGDGKNRKFLLGNGAITADGIDRSSRCNLPKQLGFYRVPDDIENHKAVQSSIIEVFKLLKFSSQNPYIGVLLCVAAIRAVISMWLPINHWFFLVGKKATYKSSVAELIQAFFGALNQDFPLVNWKSTACGLENLSKAATNGVLCVDDFVYPKTSNRASEFTQKADDVLRSMANGSPKSRASNHGSGIEDSMRLNCLVISTGEFPPRNSEESLHHRGLYIPFQAGDIKLKKLSLVQEKAKAGMFACVNGAFIQFLLADFDKNAQYCDTLFKKYREQFAQKLSGDARNASQIAGLFVAWLFFCRFAVKNNVISQDQEGSYKNDVKEVLIKLVIQQEAIYLSKPSQLFIDALKQAFSGGKAHVIDSKTGKQPLDVLPTQVGWLENKPKGLWVGWRDEKTGDIFIRGDLDIEDLLNLIPECDRTHFSTGGKKFWKELKNDNLLKCDQNSDRNTTRIKLFRAISDNHYHLNMKILSK